MSPPEGVFSTNSNWGLSTASTIKERAASTQPGYKNLESRIIEDAEGVGPVRRSLGDSRLFGGLEHLGDVATVE